MDASITKGQHEMITVRDTIESVWVAIILAFVLRAFMVEAFVIPTGSMAPRLMGEHYDLVCPACGYGYSFGWVDEHETDTVKRRRRALPKGAECPSCTCPYPYSKKSAYVNGGDRVLVMKFLYRFTEPKKFDVVVFRNPQSNANNYIKRLIGLPGETIEIIHGDVFVIPEGKDQWEVRRKPDRAQEVMWQVVFDNDYRPDEKQLRRERIGRPRCWDPDSDTGGDRGGQTVWEESGDGRTFRFRGSTEPGYLTFRGARRVVDRTEPNEYNEELATAEKEAMREAFVPRYGYDIASFETRYLNQDTSQGSDVDLCSDLKLSAVVRPLGDKTAIWFVLDGLWYSIKAEFNTDGSVTVYRKARQRQGAGWEQWARGDTRPLTTGRGYRIELAHVDYGVKVRIDGRTIIDKAYPVRREDLTKRLDDSIDNPLPRPGARIAAVGGRLDLTHIKLMRDVYYTYFELGQSDQANPEPLLDYARSFEDPELKIKAPGWGVAGNPIKLTRHKSDPDLDEFYVLGDNSPQSLDSRGWIEAAPSLRLIDSKERPQYRLGTVPRYNMIGKAMFVYWPSGFRLPLLPGLPIVPDAGKMRLIR